MNTPPAPEINLGAMTPEELMRLKAALDGQLQQVNDQLNIEEKKKTAINKAINSIKPDASAFYQIGSSDPRDQLASGTLDISVADLDGEGPIGSTRREKRLLTISREELAVWYAGYIYGHKVMDTKKDGTRFESRSAWAIRHIMNAARKALRDAVNDTCQRAGIEESDIEMRNYTLRQLLDASIDVYNQTRPNRKPAQET